LRGFSAGLYGRMHRNAARDGRRINGGQGLPAPALLHGHATPQNSPIAWQSQTADSAPGVAILIVTLSTRHFLVAWTLCANMMS